MSAQLHRANEQDNHHLERLCVWDARHRLAMDHILGSAPPGFRPIPFSLIDVPSAET